MHDTTLDPRLAVHGLDGLWQGCESVTAHDAHGVHTTVAQVGEYLQPEFGGLIAGADDQGQCLLLSLHIEAQDEICGSVANDTVDTDLHDESIDPHDRVALVEWAGLPGPDVVEDRISHIRDEVLGDIHVIDLGQVHTDLLDGHSAGVHRDDPVIKAVPVGLALFHDLGFEHAVTIPGDLDG